MKKGMPPFFIALIGLVTCCCDTCASLAKEALGILEARESKFPALWERHRDQPELAYLVLDRWAKLSPQDLLKQNLNDEELESALRLWGKHGGRRAYDLQRAAPKRDGRAIHTVIQGYAESQPEEALALVLENIDGADLIKKQKVRTGIIRGLSLQAPIRAIEFMQRYHPQRWKTYHHLAWDDRFLNGDEDRTIRIAIWRWLYLEPEHALKWLMDDDNPPLHPEFIAVLTSKIPEQVNQALDSLPTGLKKATFKKGIQLAQDNDGIISATQTIASPLEITSSRTFLKLLILANEAPPESFPPWLLDGRLDHLDAPKTDLLRAIIRERWAATDPASLVRFQVSQRDFNLADGLGAWWEKDGRGAVRFVETLGQPDSWARSTGREQFIRGIGRKSVREAFFFYQRYAHKDLLGGKDDDYDKTFLEMAEKNREAFLEFALKDGSQQQKFMTLLARVWLPIDPEWTIKTLTQHDINPFEHDSESIDFHPYWGHALFDNLSSLPESWQETLIGSAALAKKNELRWLRTKEHPSMSGQELRFMQGVIAREGYWVWRNNLAEVKKIIDEGIWLDDFTRGELASWFVIRSYANIKNLKPWILQLPLSIQEKPLKSFHYFQNEAQRRRQKGEFSRPEKLFENLFTNHDYGKNFYIENWIPAEIEAFHAQIRNLTDSQTSDFPNKINIMDLPWRIRVTILSKCVGTDWSKRRYELRGSVRNTAKEFATYDPAKAAAWAGGLSIETHRELAFREILEIWKGYDQQEAIQWISTLPKTMQEKLSF